MVTPCRLASSSTTSRLETAPANLGGGDTAADLWIKKGTAGATALDATALDAEATAIADGQRSDQYSTIVRILGKNHRRQTGRANYKIRTLDEGELPAQNSHTLPGTRPHMRNGACARWRR